MNIYNVQLCRGQPSFYRTFADLMRENWELLEIHLGH